MAYPPPPDFYKLYAPRPDDPEGASRWTPPPAPPPPVKGAYTVFGASHTTETTEPPFEQSKLYRSEGADVDLRAELARLNKEVLDRFIALTEDMIETPSAYERRVEEITLLCNNAHHLLNAIRPSQARATLEHALSEQAKQKRERLEEVRAATERAERAMENVPAILKQAVEAATAEADRDAGKSRE